MEQERGKKKQQEKKGKEKPAPKSGAASANRHPQS
jgi:hypothetical protein